MPLPFLGEVRYNSPMSKLMDPTPLTLEEGKTYFLCTCGHSAKYPLCDGAHRREPPTKRSRAFTANASKTVLYQNGEILDHV